MMSKTIQIELPEGVSESDVKIEFVAKPEPKPKLWKPSDYGDYYFVDSDGKSVSTAQKLYWPFRRVEAYNAYPTKPLADKAADYLAPYRMLVRTALEVDPDFEPDWTNSKQEKFCLYRLHGEYCISRGRFRVDYLYPVVGSREKAEQWLELVKAQEAEG